MKSLPIINLAPFLNRDPLSDSKRVAAAAALHSACVEFGFFYLDITSFVDASESENLVKLASQFFALPQEEKDKLSLKNEDYARGYAELNANVTNGKPDNHEGLDLYKPVENPDKSKLLWGVNQWPEIPDFKEKFEIWIEKMKQLGLIVMEAMSLGLRESSEEWEELKSKVIESFWYMRVIGYPLLPDSHNGYSCGAHKDYGCLTFLTTDSTPNALQVFLKGPNLAESNVSGRSPDQGSEEGVWITVDPIPGCVVCNIGEMWEIWTNGLYTSTLHRVIHKGSNYRISLPFFFEPNFDAVIEPLQSVARLRLRDGHAPVVDKHSVIYGDFLLGKMYFENISSKLRSPVKELVQSVSENGGKSMGDNDNHEKEVVGWIDKIVNEDFVVESNLKSLDSLLTPKTYVAADHLTTADVVLYGFLHPVIKGLSPAVYYTLPAVTRYFDHIQSESAVRLSAASLGDSFSIIPIDLQGTPKLKREPDTHKKKDKPTNPATGQPTTSANEPVAPSSASQQPQKKGKKKEKEDTESASNSKKQAKVPAVDDGEPVPSMIDLRVGRIVDITKHPDADSLYVEQIDIGEESPRTVVSGLVHYIPIEDMRDKYLVAVCNLKPANMRGVKSFAMVLCATSKTGKEGGIELIQPPPGSKPGDRVYFEGEDFESSVPLAQLNPKKKIFETIQPGFTTLDTKEAAWVNPVTQNVHKIRTSKGFCVAPTLVGASLS